MGFTLDKVVPWGRSYDEYVRMFALTEADLGLRMLGCGDGPAGFNAELSRQGGKIISVDPIYALASEQIRGRISETYATVMTELRKHQGAFAWETIPSPEALGALRLAAMESFLNDFKTGKEEGRYLPAELPSLPFTERAFAIALSSHLLFLYSSQLTAEFHLQALLEMLRVSRQVRVFPLLTLAGTLSPHLHLVMGELASHGFGVEIKRVAYEFQRGGNEMLLITHTES